MSRALAPTGHSSSRIGSRLGSGAGGGLVGVIPAAHPLLAGCCGGCVVQMIIQLGINMRLESLGQKRREGWGGGEWGVCVWAVLQLSVIVGLEGMLMEGQGGAGENGKSGMVHGGCWLLQW